MTSFNKVEGRYNTGYPKYRNPQVLLKQYGEQNTHNILVIKISLTIIA